MISLTKIIPSYLYQQYSDEDALIAFILSYNGLTQTYLDWFNRISLPIYTGPEIYGPMLDWVGEGVYGIRRPSLSAGIAINPPIFIPGDYGINTQQLNTAELNQPFTALTPAPPGSGTPPVGGPPIDLALAITAPNPTLALTMQQSSATVTGSITTKNPTIAINILTKVKYPGLNTSPLNKTKPNTYFFN